MVWTVHEDTYLYIFPINKDKNPVLNYQFRWEVNQKMRWSKRRQEKQHIKDQSKKFSFMSDSLKFLSIISIFQGSRTEIFSKGTSGCVYYCLRVSFKSSNCRSWHCSLNSWRTIRVTTDAFAALAFFICRWISQPYLLSDPTAWMRRKRRKMEK